jgi:hypothetical protein
MKTFFTTAALALSLTGIVASAALAQAQPRPDTEFCAKMRAKDPGGICSAKGEYVTAEKVYLPDGRIVNRSTGA